MGVKASWSLPINTSDASAQNVEPPTGTVIGGVQASLGKDNQTTSQSLQHAMVLQEGLNQFRAVQC